MSPVDPVLEHYARFDEDARLNGSFGAFELARTRELIDPAQREVLMSLARHVEADSVLSPQLFCAARRI